jgi:broad specificity phosphatase PhoE
MSSTTFLFVRHGYCDTLGKRLNGRSQGVHLNSEGKAQAQNLAERLSHLPIRAVYSSPLERAQETAKPLADRLDMAVRIAPSLTEYDFGDWNGMSFDDLKDRELYKQYTQFRDGLRPPNGELMSEVVGRVVREIEGMRERHRGQMVALVTHQDVIKAALLHYLGCSPLVYGRLEITPASVSMITIGPEGPQILRVNDVGTI